MIAPLRDRISRSQEVASRILQEVRSGRLLPGEKLGSIRLLAERFGVGRQVILSATALLSEQSVVITRSKQGTYINPNLEPGLVRERTKRIGFLNWRVGMPGVGAYSLRVYHEVLQRAPGLNCEIFWQSTNDDLDPVQWFTGMRLDAVLVTGRVDDELVMRLREHSISYLVVGNYQFNQPANCLEKAPEEDIYRVLRQFCQERGFRRLGTITSSPALLATRLYQAGAQRVADELGLRYPAGWQYSHAAEDGYVGMGQLLADGGDSPEIIYMTAKAFPGAARYLFEEHRADPERRPFLVLDYHDYAAYYPYLIDAVVYPEETLGRVALARLLDLYYGRLRQPYRERMAMV